MRKLKGNEVRKLKCLDLFCKAGGASAGLAWAGFEVVGMDIAPQPNYPFEFVHGDATQADLSGYDFVWASPPCQGYSRCKALAMARNGGQYGEHPKLIEIMREKLKQWGGCWVIENVAGAPLNNPVKLFGSQFGLLTQRQRWFEASFPLRAPINRPRKMQTPCAGNGKGPDGSISICGSGGVRGMKSKEIVSYWSLALGGVDWMSRAEMAECIPPCYGAFIGQQAVNWILHNAKHEGQA